MNVKHRNCLKHIVLSSLFCLGTGAVSAWLTIDGLRSFPQVIQPPLTPPMIVFPIVWSILLILMGIGSGLIRCNKPSAEPTAYDWAVTAFSVQLTFFFCWMIWFFGLGWYGFAVFWTIGLIASILAMIRNYCRISKAAAWMQLPYLVWCCFALYLTVGVWWLNR